MKWVLTPDEKLVDLSKAEMLIWTEGDNPYRPNGIYAFFNGDDRGILIIKVPKEHKRGAILRLLSFMKSGNEFLDLS
ncbi:hypothetical protein [Thermicanus aegyptius]|uniref:hypothetical protein n=1 Tax=Thermicanus aegyptius TaxID=94009 RepID=UPI000409D854|nr:hypothetical protein [Thermicanus aegyptius]